MSYTHPWSHLALESLSDGNRKLYWTSALSFPETSLLLTSPVYHVPSSMRPLSHLHTGCLDRTLVCQGLSSWSPGMTNPGKHSHTPILCSGQTSPSIQDQGFFQIALQTPVLVCSEQRVIGSQSALSDLNHPPYWHRKGEGGSRREGSLPRALRESLQMWLREEFYILVTLHLAGMISPKGDDTEHLRVDSCCWQTRSEVQLVSSCPTWPGLTPLSLNCFWSPAALFPRG